MQVLAARPGALQHLLHALPLARGQWRGHDRAARLSSGGQLPYPAPDGSAAGPLLRRDDPRLRRHAGVCGAGCPAGPLGHRRLHQGSAVEPERQSPPMRLPARASQSLATIAESEGLPDKLRQGVGTAAHRDLRNAQQSGQRNSRGAAAQRQWQVSAVANRASPNQCARNAPTSNK